MNLNRLTLAVAAFCSLLGGASAGTATGSITNTITVTATPTVVSCSLSGAGLNPAINYSAGGTEVNYTGPAIFLVCASTPPGPITMPASIGFGPGLNRAASYRRAANGTNFINYQLKNGYTPAGFTLDLAVGGFFGGQEMLVTVGAGIATIPYTMTVPAGQTIPAGTYTDTVTVTATY